MTLQGKQAAMDKMRDAGVHEIAVRVFSHYYDLVESGETGIIAEADIEPVVDLPHIDNVEVTDADARQAFAATAIIKLNGGLGTSMGLERAKTLLEVRDGQSFLDIIAAQVLHARRTHEAPLPLLFMNSFRTRTDTLAALEAHPDLAVEGLPLDFVQNSEPKLLADDLTPVEWPADPSLEWCPPGHGDLFTVLHTSGVLDALLEAGMRHASISNGDNLGAVPDPRLAGWFAASGAPFAMEVCQRTVNDRKGGHVARRVGGGLVLRDTAMTAPEDLVHFADEHRHPFFNTNNLWVDLAALRARLEETGGVLGLPLIRNVKTVDPTDKTTPQVIQIETGMGTGVEVFDNSTAIEVPRSRFLPVKTTNELMLLRSDLYSVDDAHRLVSQRADQPNIQLDADFYKTIANFDARVPVAPSLVEAEELQVVGDWTFAPDVVVRGRVVVEADGAPGTLSGVLSEQ